MAPPLQVADPLGLVQTQAIESAEGGLRITLNGSASPLTLSARFLQGFHGSGIQHIALSTANILASARRLRELGLASLPIPHNYYEDLALPSASPLSPAIETTSSRPEPIISRVRRPSAAFVPHKEPAPPSARPASPRA